MTSHLRQLLKVMSDGIDRIDAIASQKHASFPTLLEPFDTSSPGEQLASDPEVIPHALIVASAASQLASTVRFPGLVLFDRVMAV